MVVVLDRPRHEDGIQAIRDAGARVRLITDGDVSASLLSVSDRSPVSLLWGIGGTPEGVISAAAIKAFGGAFIGRLWPRDDGERQAAIDAGYDLDRVLDQDELVRSDDCFFSATGVTDGDVLQGVRYEGTAATTESIVMRARTGTVRRISARHNRPKLRAYIGERYGEKSAGAASLTPSGVQVERRARAVAPEADAVGRGRQRAVGVQRRLSMNGPPDPAKRRVACIWPPWQQPGGVVARQQRAARDGGRRDTGTRTPPWPDSRRTARPPPRLELYV